MSKIPLVPQWNLNNGCVCTPDGGFLYVGSRSINFISCVESEEDSPKIKVFHTRQTILGLDIDPHWGEATGGQVSTCDDGKESESPRLFVVLSQDNSVQIWDFNKGCALQGHKAHLACMRYMEGNGPFPQHTGAVFVSYMINRNVLSIDNQDIVVYCVASNSFYRRPMFVSPRNHQLSTMKCSPFNENHFAVGTSRGLVLLCDLQKMVTLYTLRGHDTCITSLAWNRIELKAEPSQHVGVVATKLEKAAAKTQKLTRSDTTMVENEDIFDIYDYDYLENEFGAGQQDSKSELVSDFVGIEKASESSGAAQFDFAEACQSLKDEINALREDLPQLSSENVVSIEDCKNADTKDDVSSCNSENCEETKAHSDEQSSDGSIVRLVCGTPSSEESVDVDGMHRVICQAEVHAALATEVKTTITTESGSNQTTFNTADESSGNVSEHTEVVKVVSTVGRSDILLASVGIDGTLCIWNAVTGATCDHHKIQSPHSSKSNKNARVHISWYDNASFILSNRGGDLQLWTMQNSPGKATDKKFQNRLYKFKECKRQWHQRRVVAFNVCQRRQLLWCITSTREISMEDMAQNKIKLQYGCVSTNISALRECPDNMNKIAIGLSDRRIGILDISKLTSTLIHIENYVQRIESPVLTLAWSPDCKKIAYGTAEGRVGIVNVEGGSPKQQTFNFNSACGKKVYSISWQDDYLYVVCNERIAVYEDNPNKKDAVVLPGITGVSAISQRDKYLLVGTQKGKLQLYERKGNENSHFEYQLKMELELSSRYITEMSWSPIATNILAVVANSNSIHIIEFKQDTGELSIMRKIEIKSDKAANACVKWSNRNENLLLTCGFDGAIRVWDLSQASDSECFIKLYHCPMSCGLFLPTDEDIVLCAGKSTSLEFIEMRTEKMEDHESKLKRLSPRTLDNVQWATKATTPNDDKKPNRRTNKNSENNLKSSENQLQLKTNLSEKFEQFGKNDEDVSKMLENLNIKKVENFATSTSIYMRNPQTLLYLTTKEINKDSLDVMHSVMTDQITRMSSDNKSLCAKLFGSKSEANQLLAQELKNHQNSETKGISSIFMPQLNANIKEEILKCVQTKQLCEWHVSLAPSISFSFWQKCCQTYAEQLIEQGYVLQGAVYYLAIHMQRDAIDVLMHRTYFKEAMLIARIYLQQDDPLFDIIAERWITHLYNNGNLTGAALLCFLSKQNDRAYECLVKIRNTGPDIERVIRLLKENSNNGT